MADATSAESIMQLFQLATEQQVTINLTFLMDLCQFSVIHGQCVLLKNKHFVVRVSLEQLKEKQLIWGADVDGFFAVRTELDRRVVHFKSRLVRLYNAPPDSMYLIFPIPSHVDQGQRRNSRRVELGKEKASAFQVWYGAMEGGDETHLPQEVWKSFRDNQCDLGELSASGMRLDFQAEDPLVGQLLIDTPVLLKGDFGPGSKPTPLFILGTVVRKMPRKDKEGLMSVGCHFFSWRRVSGPDSETWFKADPQDGIALVSQWLGRQYRGSSSLGHVEKKKEAPQGHTGQKPLYL